MLFEIDNRSAALGNRAAIPELSPAQKLAVLARALQSEGYADYHAGHISYRQPDGTFLVNPWELTWGEVRASDILHTDIDGNKLFGALTPSPALLLHYELYKVRPDVSVVLHHHPRFATVWACARRIPPVYSQFGAFVPDDLVLYDDYEADVSEASGDAARANVRALGDCSMILLANHGVLVVADSPEQALLRSAVLEQRCRIAWDLEAMGPGSGVPMPTAPAAELGRMFEEDLHGWPHFWEGLVRKQIVLDPTVLF